MNAGNTTSFLARHFNTDEQGNVTTAFSYVKSLYLAFDFSLIDLSVPQPFLEAFGPSLRLFNNLHSFTCDICEYDDNKSFVYITMLGIPGVVEGRSTDLILDKVRATLAPAACIDSNC